MKDLIKITEQSENSTMSSREIAGLTEKEHKNVLVDCDNLNENYRSLGMAEISAVKYKADNGQFYREYLLTKIQSLDLMTGYRTDLRIKVNRRWEELENKTKLSIDQITKSDLALMILESEEEKKLLQEKIEAQAPAVLFRDAITSSVTNILINDLAKLLNQNGVNIGQDRLYKWLVENKYLICKQRWSNRQNKYINDYMPTQYSADLKLFFVTEYPIITQYNSFVKHTVKVTGKGQEYFINKFIKNQILCEK